VVIYPPGPLSNRCGFYPRCDLVFHIDPRGGFSFHRAFARSQPQSDPLRGAPGAGEEPKKTPCPREKSGRPQPPHGASRISVAWGIRDPGTGWGYGLPSIHDVGGGCLRGQESPELKLGLEYSVTDCMHVILIAFPPGKMYASKVGLVGLLLPHLYALSTGTMFNPKHRLPARCIPRYPHTTPCDVVPRPKLPAIPHCVIPAPRRPAFDTFARESASYFVVW